MQGYNDVIMFKAFDGALFETEEKVKNYVNDKVCEIFDQTVGKNTILREVERFNVIEDLSMNVEELYKKLFKIYGEI